MLIEAKSNRGGMIVWGDVSMFMTARGELSAGMDVRLVLHDGVRSVRDI